MIPLSDKDAKDLQRWNNEQEDQRRINTRGSKATRRSAVPGLRDLNKMLRERPFGAGSGQSSASTEKPLMVSREKDRFGKYKNVPVGLPEGQRNLINSIKFDKFGDAVVNGRYAPELTNTLKSMIKGTLQVPGSGLPTGAIFTEPPQALNTGQRSNLPTGVIGYDASGRPIMSKSMAPRSTTPFIADGVRVTDSLLRTYITQLEKNSGVTGTTPFSSRQLGPELYERLFSSPKTSKTVFVFGSNLEGVHGKGAALEAAQKYGAVRGQGVGLQGQSYAIPTKSTPYKTLDLPEIKKYVNEFLDFARKNPDTKFNLTAIGTGLAGLKPNQIAPLFADAPENVIKPKEFGGTGWAMPTGKTQLSNIEQSRARLKQLQDLKKSVGGGNLSRREAAELSRLKETIRKATTVDPTLTDMPEESASKIKVSNPEEFQKMRNRFKELDTIMKTKGLAGAELAEYERLEQSIRSVRTEATQRPGITSDKPGKIVSEKTKPETKVSIKNIGDTKAPGIYTDGKYNPKVTLAAVDAIIKMSGNAKYRQVIGRQGGIRIGNVFVAVEDMQQLAKSVPAGQTITYDKKGNPMIKPTSKPGGGAFFGIAGKLLGPLSVIAQLGDLARLAREWSSENRKVPIS